MRHQSQKKKQQGGTVDTNANLTTLHNIRTLSNSIDQKKDKLSALEKRVRDLTELNDNLTHGYELSLKLVVDVSKLLQDYSLVFDNIESSLTNIDRRLDGIKSGDISEINLLTKRSIQKIATDFEKQYPIILKSLEKQQDPSSATNAAKLKSLVSRIYYGGKRQRQTRDVPR